MSALFRTADPTDAKVVGFRIAGQLFGIAVASVRDVLIIRQFAPIPLAQPEILGVLNLRGRVVTVVDLHRRLGLATTNHHLPSMSVVIEHAEHLHALLVESVGDVVTLPVEGLLPIPPTLPQTLRGLAHGVVHSGCDFMVLLDVARIFELEREAAA